MLTTYLKSCTAESAHRHASTVLQQLSLTMYRLCELASMFKLSFKTEDCAIREYTSSVTPSRGYVCSFASWPRPENLSLQL